MAEPLTLSAVLLTTFAHVYYHLVGGMAHHRAEHILEHWREAAVDPRTGLPRNHDIQEASESALRAAVNLLVLELAGRLDPGRSWLTRAVERDRRTGWLARPLFSGDRSPQQQWLDAFRAAVADRAFDDLHRLLGLGDDQVLECFRKGDVCRVLDPMLADKLLEWTRANIKEGTEPEVFETLVGEGWKVPAAGEAPPLSAGLVAKGVAGSSTGRAHTITLAQAYCLFYREHLKNNPKVFNIFTADTLTAMGAKLDTLGGALRDELDELRARVATAEKNPPNFAQFDDWLTPQLGELKELFASVQGQLETLARGQDGLKSQQGEILVVLVTLATEVRRGNEDAARELAELCGLLARQHADQMAAHDLTHESLGAAHQKLDALAQRVGPARRPPFDRLPAIRAGVLLGRDAQRDDLAARLRRGEDVCVVGPGGFGKTALAADAIRVALGETAADLAGGPFPDGLVFLDLYQLKADREKVWHTLADRFAPGAHADRPARERARLVCAELRALVVLEGAEEAGTGLPELLAVLGTRLRRLVLTRDSAQDTTGRPIRLDRELAPADAYALLRCLSPGRGTDAQLEDIVSLLGGHPLALTNAGCQLANPDDSPAAFLEDLRAAPLDRNAEPGNPGHPLRWSYDRSWRLLGDHARQALRAAGCLAYAPFGLGAAEAALMPTALSSAGGEGRSEGAARARAALRRLVQHGFLAPPTDTDDRWRISHALAYRYATDSLAPLGGEGRGEGAGSDLLPALAGWVVAAFAAAVKAFQRAGSPKLPQDPQPVRDALAHATALLAREQPPAAGLARRLADLVDGMPQPGQTVVLRPALADISRQLYERIKAADESGQAELKALRATLAGTLANWLSELGRRAEALEPAQEAVDLRRALARANPDAFNPDLASSLHNLAKFLSELGRRAEALEPAQEAVDLRRALARANPDAFHPDLASSLGVMGQVLEAHDDLEAALACFREGVEILAPAFRQLPEAFAPLMQTLVAEYRRVLAATGREPDPAGTEAFLVPVTEAWQHSATNAPPP